MDHRSPAQQREVHFSPADRHGLYKAIFNRRDVRGQFKPDPIPEAVLSRILLAAHHAPSVGFMQPWDFVIVTDPEVKRQVHAGFLEAQAREMELFSGDRKELYRTLKLEGIMEAPVNICVTCDRGRTGAIVLGRTNDMAMDLYSSVCAVQNLWLAARAEGLGVGWVSILHRDVLPGVLGIPEPVVPIAYLCMGYVTGFHERPELETARWLPRLPLDDLVHGNTWGNKDAPSCASLKEHLRQDMARARQGTIPDKAEE
ncbi:MAG: 5,6-dimethylbenzimidazole synthase [Magnetococcales bacterium]|nr:5,6-dimethylbenzimidazole synthase [Magnetococcales bacterium]MBF0148777.1 5,6-dimethylbenzimidazole synthase [Magnetococcales bacterium]